MNNRNELKHLLWIVISFSIIYYLPIGNQRFDKAIFEALHLIRLYAQEHVILCLIPAFFIAGAITVYIDQSSVIKHLGSKANKAMSYSVASVSGTLLAVCSCTVLPLFAGIYRMGAGIGPASAFLYSGPAINILAIVLTANVLGLEMGLARAIGAIAFSIIIGICMEFFFRKENPPQASVPLQNIEPSSGLTSGQSALHFFSLAGILVFTNWSKPVTDTGLWNTVFQFKWLISAAFAFLLAFSLYKSFKVSLWKILTAIAIICLSSLFSNQTHEIPFVLGLICLIWITFTSNENTRKWLFSSFDYTRMVLPLLLLGVFAAGFLLGRPGNEGIVPSIWISSLLGGNSIQTNLFASIAGAFMYFATLTEVPIIQSLMGSGMGKGPALSLLLAGPALSLPSMLVIRQIIGTKKTLVFIALVIVMATTAGTIYGSLNF